MRVVAVTVVMVVAVQRQPRRRGHHRRVQVAALPVLTGSPARRWRGCGRRRWRSADRLRSPHRQRRHARSACGWWRTAAWSCPSRAADQVERRHAVVGEVLAVLRRDAVVLAQHVGFELDGALGAHARHRRPWPGRHRSAGRRSSGSPRPGLRCRCCCIRRRRTWCDALRSWTLRSTTFNSVPPVGCSCALPQRGQSSRPRADGHRARAAHAEGLAGGSSISIGAPSSTVPARWPPARSAKPTIHARARRPARRGDALRKARVRRPASPRANTPPARLISCMAASTTSNCAGVERERGKRVSSTSSAPLASGSGRRRPGWKFHSVGANTR